MQDHERAEQLQTETSELNFVKSEIEEGVCAITNEFEKEDSLEVKLFAPAQLQPQCAVQPLVFAKNCAKVGFPNHEAKTRPQVIVSPSEMCKSRKQQHNCKTGNSVKYARHEIKKQNLQKQARNFVATMHLHSKG